MKRTIVISVLLLALVGPLASADEQQKHSHKWATIMSVVGVGGGLLLGEAVGLGAYDDAINSDQKATAAATAGAVTGGVLGFFLGMHMDNNRNVHEARLMPEIRWRSVAPELNLFQNSSRSGLMSDADPIELLARASAPLTVSNPIGNSVSLLRPGH